MTSLKEKEKKDMKKEYKYKRKGKKIVKCLKEYKKFQSLILNLNDNNTDEEISFKVRKLSKKLKERKEKMIQQDKTSATMIERNKNETINQKIIQYD